MAENKQYIYEIIIDTKRGTASINGTSVALDKLDAKLRQVTARAQQAAGATKQMGDASGLASAAVVELGRTASDAGYGLTAMTNNIQQLGTLFTTLIGRTGQTGIAGVTGALRMMGASLMGPLGIIVLFQAATAALEYFTRKQKDAKEAVQATTDSLEIQLSTLGDMQTFLEVSFGDSLDSIITALSGRFALLGRKIEELNPKDPNYKKKVEDLVGQFAELLQVQKEIADTEKLLGETDSFLNPKTYFDLTRELANLIVKAEELKAALAPDPKPKKGAKQSKVFGATAGNLPSDFGFYGGDISAELRRKQVEVLMEIELNKLLTKEEAQELKERQRLRELDMKHRTEMFRAIGEGLQHLGFLLGESTEAGKGIAAAGAIIDTYAAADAILKNAAKTPAGGIPGYAIAQAGAAILFGLAQVKQIYSVKVPKAKGGSSAGGGSQPAAVQPPSFNIVGDTGQNQIRRTIESALEKPIQTFITTKQIRNAEELDRNIRSGAKVG